jgi:hypothetical protein
VLVKCVIKDTLLRLIPENVKLENNSGRLVATATRRPKNIYILDMKKREKTEATQKDSKEEKVPKTKNKDEVLLSATCSGGAAPKKRVTFFH